MCSVAVIFVLASSALAQAEDSTDEFVNQVVNKMFERALEALPLNHADLDDATLGKAGHGAISSSAGSLGTRIGIPSGVIAPVQPRLGLSSGVATPLKPLSSDIVDPFSRRDRTIVAAKREVQRAPKQGRANQRPDIPVPPVDEENEEFIIFVRSKKIPFWTPCTMIKGNSAVNQLVKSLPGDGGKSLQRDTMMRNIGESIYGNSKDLIKAAKKMSKGLQYATEFEWAFKIRDKNKPAEWYVSKDLTIVPPQDELPKAPLDDAKNAFEGVKEGFQNMFKQGK